MPRRVPLPVEVTISIKENPEGRTEEEMRALRMDALGIAMASEAGNALDEVMMAHSMFQDSNFKATARNLEIWQSIYTMTEFHVTETFVVDGVIKVLPEDANAYAMFEELKDQGVRELSHYVTYWRSPEDVPKDTYLLSFLYRRIADGKECYAEER